MLAKTRMFALSTLFLEKRGWYAEKLYVTLWYQIRGESVPDGSRGLSHVPFVCIMDVVMLHFYYPVLTRFYEGFCVRFVLVACDMFIFPRICLCCENVLELFVILLFVDFTYDAAGKLHYTFIL